MAMTDLRPMKRSTTEESGWAWPRCSDADGCRIHLARVLRWTVAGFAERMTSGSRIYPESVAWTLVADRYMDTLRGREDPQNY